VVFIVKGGVSTFSEDQGFRLIIDGLWVGGLIFYGILMLTLRKQSQVDERDRSILGRAPVVQLWAVIFSLVIWTIVAVNATGARGFHRYSCTLSSCPLLLSARWRSLLVS